MIRITLPERRLAKKTPEEEASEKSGAAQVAFGDAEAPEQEASANPVPVRCRMEIRRRRNKKQVRNPLSSKWYLGRKRSRRKNVKKS